MGNHRRLHVIKGKKGYHILDHWNDRPYHSYLYSTVFTESIFLHEKESLPSRYPAHSLLLNLICPFAKRGEVVALCGESEQLGAWDPKKAKRLSCVNDGEWQILLNTAELLETSAYKFVIIEQESGATVHWEEGDNRVLDIRSAGKANCVAVQMSLQYRYPSFSFKGTGTAIPVFSLRTDRSFGIETLPTCGRWWIGQRLPGNR